MNTKGNPKNAGWVDGTDAAYAGFGGYHGPDRLRHVGLEADASPCGHDPAWRAEYTAAYMSALNNADKDVA